MSEHEPHGDTRRTFMKKGAVATGALALGAGATAGYTAAQQQEEMQALVYSYEYWPNTEFEVVSQLQQQTVVDLLDVGGGGDGPSVLERPDEWDGYVIRYQIGQNGGGINSFLFIRDGNLSTGETHTTSGEAQMFSPERNLLRVTLDGGGGGGEQQQEQQTNGNETDDQAEMEANETDDEAEMEANETDDEAEMEANETDDEVALGNETDEDNETDADNETPLI